jgi:hypothetical protein
MERKRGLVCSGLGEREEKEVWFENLCKYMGRLQALQGSVYCCVLCTVIVFLRLFLKMISS